MLRNVRVSPACVLAILLAAAVLVNLIYIVEFDFTELGFPPPASQTEPAPQPTEPPVPDQVTVDETLPPAVDVPVFVDPKDFAVKIANYTMKKTQGYGVSVTYEGMPLVLSSRMIFAEGVGGITVDKLPAWPVADDDLYQVIALNVFTEDIPEHGVYTDALPAVELSQQDCAGTVTIAVPEGTLSVDLKRAFYPPGAPRNSVRDWFILAGVDKPCTGAPVFINDSLVGLIIGRNQKVEGEVIMVGTETLIKLAKEATK